MQDQGHSRNNSNIEDILFQLDSKSYEANNNKELSPIFPGSPLTPEISSRKKESRISDYSVKDEDEMLAFTSLDPNALMVQFEDDATLKIKARNVSELKNHHLTHFEKATKKLSDFNTRNRQPEPETFWQWVYSGLLWYVTPARKIPRHLRVTKIIVTLSECQEIDDEGLEFLTEFIKCFEYIKHLEFEVKGTGATDQTLGLVSSLLNSLKYLTYYYIDFSECKITDEGMFFLVNAIKNKKKLEELWLRFSWCPDNAITNDSFVALSKSLETCKSLKVLLLEFNGQQHIGSKGLSGVLGALKDKDMQRIYLYFEKSQVNDNFLNYCGEILPLLYQIEVFGLNLANSNFVTIKGIKELEKGLGSLRWLRTGLYLYFSGCFGVLEKEKMKVAFDELIERKKVKNYVIEFE